VECSILGNEEPIASLPCRVTPYDEFYTYDAKYIAGKALFEIPLKADSTLIQKIQKLAIKAYQTLCCEGLARLDMFVKDTGEVLINEINTMPGFTKTSIYPMLWEASGMSLTEVADRLIQLALEKFEKEKKLKTSFEEIHSSSANNSMAPA
jgi:D-alanine-D-alanine ligase